MSNKEKLPNNRISVRLPLDKVIMLNELAKKENTTVSKLIQNAVTAKFRETKS